MLNQIQAEEFCRLRREAIALNYQHLNPQQRQAVLATEGPLLLLAGAGSGKTTVLIHRVANLMRYGRGSDSSEVPEWVEPEDLDFLRTYVESRGAGDKIRADRLCALEPAPPWTILAITFTNKAAGELKERLERMLGPEARDVWASTFHSACVRILRRVKYNNIAFSLALGKDKPFFNSKFNNSKYCLGSSCRIEEILFKKIGRASCRERV